MSTCRERGPLAQPLGLGVEARRGRDATAEQAVHHDVDAAEVGQREDLDVELGRLGQQLAHERGRDQCEQPGHAGVVRGRAVVGDPQADVGVAALVAGPGVDERAERQPALSVGRRVASGAPVRPIGVGATVSVG